MKCSCQRTGRQAKWLEIVLSKNFARMNGPHSIEDCHRGLTRYFGGDVADAQGWVNLQATYDFKVARKGVAKAIAKVVQPRE